MFICRWTHNCKNKISFRLIHMLNAVPNKELGKLILKLVGKTIGPRLAKTLLREREKKRTIEQHVGHDL